MQWLGELWRDASSAMRGFLRDPVFAGTLVITLSLAIGATTAVFTAFKVVLLDPLPYHDAERLVMLWEKSPNSQADQCGLATYEYWKEENTVFDSIGYLANMSAPYDRTAWSQGGMRNFLISFKDDVSRVRGRYASSELFKVFRVEAILGRALAPEDDLPGNSPVAVISYDYWQRFHQGSSEVLQESVNVTDKRGRNYTPYRIVGVMPPGIKFPPDADFWLSYSGLVDHDKKSFAPTCWVIGRLKQGVTIEHAKREMNLVQNRIYDAHPEAHHELGSRVELVPLLTQMTGRESQIVLTMTLVGVLFVLLIACVNVAHLLLARGLSRRQETAIRIALGASPFRILRQLMTESLMLALVSCGLGIALASFVCRVLPSLDVGQSLGAGQFRYNRLAEMQIDTNVLLFALLVSVATAMIFGLAPALQSLRVDVNNSLKAEGRGGGGTRWSRAISSAMATTAMVFAVVLVSGAGLMVTSLRNMLRVDTGVDAEKVMFAEIDLPVARRRYSGNKQEVTERIMMELQAVPGVQSVSASSDLPFVDSQWATRFSTEQVIEDKSSLPEVFGRTYTPGVFKTLGIDMLSGRDFNEFDNWSTEQVMIVNEEFAKLNFPNENPIGKVGYVGDPRERISEELRDQQKRKIVGIASNVRSPRLAGKVMPEFYVSYTQNYYWDGPEVGPLLLIRTKLDPLDLISAVRDRVESGENRGKTLVRFKTIPKLLADTTAETRFASILLSAFAFLATLLAAVGFYGVFSHGAKERKREIEIRVAVGASPFDILSMFMKEALRLALLGIGIGAIAAVAMARVLSSLMVEIAPFDLKVFLFVTGILLAIVFLSAVLATRNAFRVDATNVFREGE